MSEESKAGKYFLYLDMGDQLDQDQLDRLTRQLQNEILDQDVEDAGLVSSDEIPEGAKAASAITWGAIAIEVLPTFLPGVVGFLKSWVNREETRNVKIKTQVGDKTVELEYSSSGIRENEVNELVSLLSASLREQSAEAQKTEITENEETPVQPEAEVKEEILEVAVETSTVVEEKAEEKPPEQPQDQPGDEKSEDLAEEGEEED